MKLSTIILSTLLATALPQTISAQGIFNEMLFAKDKTVFTLNSPDRPTLRLYDNGTDGKAIKAIRMKKAEDGLWRAEVKGDISGKFYTFDTGNSECPGLFAKAVGVNGNRAAVVDMRSTDPDGWLQDKRPPLKSPCDLIIYEFHHRDFSIDPSSGLQHKGKFLALTEPKATDYL